MYVYNSRKLIEVWAPAKLNLFLEVLARRPDGFHEIETLMVPINLFDTLYVERCDDSDVQLACRVVSGFRNDRSQIVDVPTTENNLVYRAIERLRQETGCSKGLKCTLIKRIPSAAGMGGGSSDAAAVLVAANLLWELDCSIADLAHVAASLGSDIPYFLYAAACTCRGRGEVIEPIPQRTPLHLVVVKPPVGLSTAEVYHQTSQRFESGAIPTKEIEAKRVGEKEVGSKPVEAKQVAAKCVEPMVESIAQGDAATIGKQLFNRLQEAATCISDEVEELSHRFSRLDVLGHQMSGSGSSYFAICRNATHAKLTAAKLNARGSEKVFVARTIGGHPLANTRFCRPSHN